MEPLSTMKAKLLIPTALVILAVAAVAGWDYSNHWSLAGRFVPRLSGTTGGGAEADPNRLCTVHGYPESVCYRCNPSAELKAEFAADFDWCKEHALPESQCETCDPFARFKAEGDWCAEHGTPESRCAQCNPSLATAASDEGPPNFLVERTGSTSEPVPNSKVRVPSPQSPVPNWCEHGFEKANCYRCEPKLEAKFKEAGDWCGGHNVPESQCTLCNPDVEAKVKERLEHSVPRAHWCEHGFEKANCFRCDSKLEAKFREAQDWCGGHEVPESQCTLCNPDVEAKVKERLQPSPTNSQSPIPSSQFCTTHLLRVRLAGLDMADKIGLEIEPARKRAVREVIRCNAEVIYNTTRLARLSSRFDGVVESIFVEVGEAVKAGQVVAVVESPALGEARSDYLQAMRELKIAQAVFEKVSQVAEQTQGLLRAVQPALSTREQLRAWEPFRAGEARSALTSALNRLDAARTALAAARKLHQQRRPVAEATRKMVELLRKNELTAREAQEKLKGLQVGKPKATLLQELSELELARTEFLRQEKLKTDGVGTEKAWQHARKEQQSAAAAYEALLEQMALSAEQELLDLDSSLKSAAQAAVASEAEFGALRQELAVRSELELLQSRKELQLAESAVTSARRRLLLFGLPNEEIEAGGTDSVSRYSLKTPFDGVVVERRAVKGEVKRSGETVAVVADLSKLWLKLDVLESELPRLKVGQPVRFHMDGLKGLHGEGRLVWLGSEVNDKTRMVNVRAEIDNTEGFLRVNMFGQGTVLVHQDEEVLTVPKEAVQWEGCCYVVFAKVSGSVFVPRKVRLGFEGPDFYEVLSGLAEGESVVTKGSFLLKTEILKSSIGAGCCE